jgi:hypothetical protein
MESASCGYLEWTGTWSLTVVPMHLLSLACSAALLSCEPDVSREQHYQVLLREHMACAWSPSMITLLDAEGKHSHQLCCSGKGCMP